MFPSFQRNTSLRPMGRPRICPPLDRPTESKNRTHHVRKKIDADAQKKSPFHAERNKESQSLLNREPDRSLYCRSKSDGIWSPFFFIVVKKFLDVNIRSVANLCSVRTDVKCYFLYEFWLYEKCMFKERKS